ncbi:hypothetical protein WS54_15710 [Burkholderia sp. NRF60-BP8]|nr:hypothetical protein WS54_15710 [Burkholderia sp. NRF60-BP8]
MFFRKIVDSGIVERRIVVYDANFFVIRDLLQVTYCFGACTLIVNDDYLVIFILGFAEDALDALFQNIPAVTCRNQYADLRLSFWNRIDDAVGSNDMAMLDTHARFV